MSGYGDRGALTPTMRVYLEDVAEGRSTKASALAHGVSPATVRTVLEAARARLGAPTTAAAVAIAIRSGELGPTATDGIVR